jgi:hypothetical protein
MFLMSKARPARKADNIIAICEPTVYNSRQRGLLYISQPCRPPRPVTRMVLLHWFGFQWTALSYPWTWRFLASHSQDTKRHIRPLLLATVPLFNVKSRCRIKKCHWYDKLHFDAWPLRCSVYLTDYRDKETDIWRQLLSAATTAPRPPAPASSPPPLHVLSHRLSAVVPTP